KCSAILLSTSQASPADQPQAAQRTPRPKTPPEPDRDAQATPAPQPPAKPSAAKDELEELFKLPLGKLAEQPVRVAVPAPAVAPGVAAAVAAPSAAVTPVRLGPLVTAASRREARVSAAPA